MEARRTGKRPSATRGGSEGTPVELVLVLDLIGEGIGSLGRTLDSLGCNTGNTVSLVCVLVFDKKSLSTDNASKLSSKSASDRRG